MAAKVGKGSGSRYKLTTVSVLPNRAGIGTLATPRTVIQLSQQLCNPVATTPLRILQEYFGHAAFHTAQLAVIRRLIETPNRAGHSLLLMPTGGGKSLCYQVPALMLDGGTLVVSPLIALMQDQVDRLRQRNIPATFINSTVAAEERESRLRGFLEGSYKLLYVTPERFRRAEFAQAISQANIALLAVDEAHCISEWGHDFRPDYSRLAEFRAMTGNPLTIALTATATAEVQQEIIEKLGLQPDQVQTFHQGIERPNLRLEVEDLDRDHEKLAAMMGTIQRFGSGSGIIYFSLIQTLEKFSQMLADKRIGHGIYHGKMGAQRRRAIQREFLAGKERLMLATNAFGMGIDKADIRFVVHAEVPSSVESYYQEIGRAGRDGEGALCVLLYNQEDLATQMEFVKWSNPNAGFYSRLYGLLSDEEHANRMGMEYLREQLNYRNRRDFRLETALGMLDRYGVTEGSIEGRDLRITGDLADELVDDERLAGKLRRANLKLLSMVQYVRTEGCRRVHISDYFGFPGAPACGNCDRCSLAAEEF
ncbi:MAG: RecQ family ATP-dependent DNA helicase [Candidatus Kapabacteria bacterium]|nr:RecQ family ATP-dependent DNA helicase [Candidatus Kapabacteria bacterium]